MFPGAFLDTANPGHAAFARRPGTLRWIQEANMDNEVWRWVWTGLALLMGAGEIVTAGFFLLPFAVGAGLAAAAAWMGIADVVQWLLFFVGTGISFLYVRRFMKAQDEDTGLVVGPGRYVGMEALVLERIDAGAATGLIRVEAEEWRAITDGEAINKGARVEVVALRGTRLVVKEVD